MKTVLLSFAVVLASLVITHSLPYHNWINEFEDLNGKQFLELQEQATSPPRLNCAVCPEDCPAEEEIEECEEDFQCATVEGVNSVTGENVQVKACFLPLLCGQVDDICNGLNDSNSNQIGAGSCSVSCCDTDRCNVEPTPPPTTPTTEPPTPPPTTPTTEPPTPPPTTPTTTPAPMNIPLGLRGVIESPGFNGNTPYAANLNVTWTRSVRGRSVLVLWFNRFNTEAGRDILTVWQGNILRRRFDGSVRRGKRSAELNLFPEDGPCERDDDEFEDVYDDDTAYESLADAYVHYLFRRRQPRRCEAIRFPHGRPRNYMIRINFLSDGNNSGATGFRIRYSIRRGGGDDK